MEQKIYDIIPPEAVQERGFGIEKKPPEERGRFFKKRFWAPLIFLILSLFEIVNIVWRLNSRGAIQRFPILVLYPGT